MEHACVLLAGGIAHLTRGCSGLTCLGHRLRIRFQSSVSLREKWLGTGLSRFSKRTSRVAGYVHEERPEGCSAAQYCKMTEQDMYRLRTAMTPASRSQRPVQDEWRYRRRQQGFGERHPGAMDSIEGTTSRARRPILIRL